jgi:hypothetical protein
LIAVGFLLFLGYIVQIGGFTAAAPALTGRTIGDPRSQASSAYLYFGPFLSIPAALILWETGRLTRSSVPRFLAILAAIEVAAVTLPRGDRIWLSELLFSIASFYYLSARRRPSWLRVFAAVLAFVMLSQILLHTRVSRTRGRLSNTVGAVVSLPGKTMRDFVLGPDLSMFSVMAIEADLTPSVARHHPGSTLASLFTGPIPGFVWHDKPQSADVQLYTALFPQQADITPAGTSPSLFGGLYFDSGFIGVVLGALIVGWLVRCVWEYARLRPDNATVNMGYAAVLPLLVVFLRGNPTDLLARATYVVLPVAIFGWWLSRRQTQNVESRYTARLPRDRRYSTARSNAR